MRARPERLERLPEQYFAALLARVAAAAALDGEPLVDLGRGNPDVGPPPHVAEALDRSARRPDTHGYAPFAGLAALKEAIAARYRDVYGVALDPSREVAVLPGSKTGLMEFAQVCVERGDTIVLPDPGYPDYRSAVALAGASLGTLPLLDDGRPDWEAAPAFGCGPLSELPVEPGRGVRSRRRVRGGDRMGARARHVGAPRLRVRRPRLRRAQAAELSRRGRRARGRHRALLDVEVRTAWPGWRLGFIVGNAEIVARVENLQSHQFAGIFMPVQEAGIAALTGPAGIRRGAPRAVRGAPQPSSRSARRTSPPRGEGTFFVWFRLPDGLTPERLLEEHRVAIAPGEGFGERGRGWARLSLATADEALDLGLERLRAALG